MTPKYDCLVIGGGPSGSCTAILLARAGWKVALVERKQFPRRKVCGEYLSASNWPILRGLGIADAFVEEAGPEIKRVGLFSGPTVIVNPLPRPGESEPAWGRALSRERLDTILLERARKAAVEVIAPATVQAIVAEQAGYTCVVRDGHGGATRSLQALIIIDAHGSWDRGPCPSQSQDQPRPGDLFAFKAHFRGADLSPDLMPLVCFPGGYGGMVTCEGGRVSLSCCIRRETLKGIRPGHGEIAGEAVGDYVRSVNQGVSRVLRSARLDSQWLAVGPIRPGRRLRQFTGIFPVGNAAGEAHPVIAEGISMALQSGWLLARELNLWRERGMDVASLTAVFQNYAKAWQARFWPRLLLSQFVAQLAMGSASARAMTVAVNCFPGLLAWGALWSGKIGKAS